MQTRADRGFAAGVAVVTTLGVIDLVLPVSLLGGLVVGVFVAALAATPRQVVLTGCYALAWVLLLGFDGEHWTGAHGLRLALNLVGVAAAVWVAVGRERHVAALVRTTDVAEAAQRALLRPLAERYDGVELAVRYLSAADGALVGGDVYDTEVTPWGLRVLVGDVCGHGLDAIDRASTLVFAFREAAYRCETLHQLAVHLDESLRRRAPDVISYATALLLQVKDGEVEIANCGHPDPLLMDGGRIATWLRPDERSRPIGLQPAPISTRLTLLGGAQLLAYTDGLTEARNASGEFFDLEPHACAAFERATLGQALDELITKLRHHADGRLRDDVVVLAMRRS